MSLDVDPNEKKNPIIMSSTAIIEMKISINSFVRAANFETTLSHTTVKSYFLASIVRDAHPESRDFVFTPNRKYSNKIMKKNLQLCLRSFWLANAVAHFEDCFFDSFLSVPS